MHQRLKERLVGAAVLVILAVIFIPMILTGPVDSGAIKETNIPAKPDKTPKPTLIPITDANEVIDTETVVTNNDAGKETEAQQEAAEREIAPVPVPRATQPQSESKIATETAKPKPAEPTTKSATKETDKPVGLSAWVVQLGSFATKVNADKLNLRLRKAGFPAFVEPLKQGDKIVYRVRVGPELLRSDADKLLAAIKSKLELEGIVLRYP